MGSRGVGEGIEASTQQKNVHLINISRHNKLNSWFKKTSLFVYRAPDISGEVSRASSREDIVYS